jgi:hypothetical protein
MGGHEGATTVDRGKPMLEIASQAATYNGEISGRSPVSMPWCSVNAGRVSPFGNGSATTNTMATTLRRRARALQDLLMVRR